jgi:WD40 repeat protein
MNQAARNEELLNTARDCYHFVTKFFEPINVSATHIYHSALELSPLSSIVRRLYYHQWHTPLPRVVAGTPGSWDQTTAISQKDRYNSCTWSPCGQFFATQAQQVVEIWDPLTFELLSTLTTPDAHLIGGPAYSPDGLSLASLSNTSLIIWDIQTGGVAKEIRHDTTRHASLVWSLDGGTICTIFGDWFGGPWTVYTCNVTLDTRLSYGTLHSREKPYLCVRATLAPWDANRLITDDSSHVILRRLVC